MGIQPVAIALVGDYDAGITAHAAIEKSLQLASAAPAAAKVVWRWLSTPQLAASVQELIQHDAVWCVPGSPYRSAAGALAGIQAARTRNIPFLGTCGGCQHALLEYARNVLGIGEAEHEEEAPHASLPLISALSCSLVEVENEVSFTPGSFVRRIYGTAQSKESYHCRYGLNPRLEYLISGSDMEITGRDKNGEARAFEIRNRWFYILTQFQPERSGLIGRLHPVIEAFLEAAREQKVRSS